MASDLQNLLNILSQSSADTAKASATYTDIVARSLDEMRAATAARAQGTDASGRTPQQVQDELLGKQASEQAAIRLRNAGGVTADANDVLVRTLAENAARFEEAKALKAELDRKNSVDFFDNPLVYISNQLTVGDTVKKYNATVDQYNLNVDHIQALNASIQEGSATYAATKQTVTDAGVASAVRASEAMIRADVATMNAKTYLTNADAVKAVMEMNDQQVRNASAALSAVNQARSLEVQQAHLRLAQEESARQREKLGSDNEALVAAFVEGYKSIHGVAPNITKAKELQNLDRLSPTVKDQISVYVDHGVQIQYDLRAPKQIGITPSEAMGVVETTKAPLTPSQQKVYQTLHKQARADLQELVATGGVKGGRGGTVKTAPPKTPEDQRFWIDQRVRELAALQQSEIKAKDGSNIYSAPPLETVVVHKNVASLPATKVILRPLVAAGVKDITPQELVDKVSSAVKQKLVTPQQGVNLITAYYKAGNLINHADMQYESLAVPQDGSYKTRIVLPKSTIGINALNVTSPAVHLYNAAGIGQESKIYDLTSEEQVKELLLRANMTPLERVVK